MPATSGAGRSDVHHAEAVALGVGEDHVVRVGRPLVPMDLGRPEADQAPHLAGLVLGVQVEVDLRRDLHRRPHPVEGDVRSRAVARLEQDEVVVGARARLVAQGRRPERRLALQVLDADDDRADAEHGITVHRHDDR